VERCCRYGKNNKTAGLRQCSTPLPCSETATPFQFATRLHWATPLGLRGNSSSRRRMPAFPVGQPRWGVGAPQPRVGARASHQPWALLGNPVGVERQLSPRDKGGNDIWGGGDIARGRRWRRCGRRATGGRQRRDGKPPFRPRRAWRKTTRIHEVVVKTPAGLPNKATRLA
jgi:hypothetical protein